MGALRPSLSRNRDDWRSRGLPRQDLCEFGVQARGIISLRKWHEVDGVGQRGWTEIGSARRTQRPHFHFRVGWWQRLQFRWRKMGELGKFESDDADVRLPESPWRNVRHDLAHRESLQMGW